MVAHTTHVNSSYVFNGRVDEVSLYKRLLTADERTWMHNSGNGRAYSEVAGGFTYGDASHKHAVTALAGNTYAYDANGNQITRVIGADTFNLKYDTDREAPPWGNRLVEVKKNNVVIATFTFDADGKRVKSVMDGETILFVGAHFEIKNGNQITKYYMAGSTRVAMRKYTAPQPMTVEYMLSDHLGSTSLTADADGNKVLEIRYKAWGEIRATWTSSPSTTPAYKVPLYQYTGQASYMDDPTTSGVTEGFGLMFYQSRFYDPYINHFVQADTIIPQEQGTQAWDRYAGMNNNPVRYNDPTGHMAWQGDGGCTNEADCKVPPPPQTCNTVTCRAANGDIGAIFELLFPSHWGWNVQAGGSVGLPIGFDIGVEVNASVVYYWRTDQLIGNVDFGIGPGVGVKLLVPGQIAGTTGPVLGWSQSDPTAGDLSVSLGGSIAAEGAVAVSASTPVNLTSNGPELYVDPVYGQIPATAYGGVGVGCCAAGGNVMVSGSIYQSDLSFLLPWNWW